MAEPVVRVIAHTKFLGVPEELKSRDILDTQDQGSYGARLIECAGRTCYDSYGAGKPSDKYHPHILEVGHGSVLEHASISFFLSGLSRGLTHELVRHRVGVAISQRSTRYVDESESPWIWHPLIDKAMTEYMSEDNYECSIAHDIEDMLTDTRQMCQEAYLQLVEWLQKYLIDSGVDKFTARKQARGAARGALGNALETEMVWTANIRALRHFIEMRATEFADAEIRVLANKILVEAQKVVPEYFSDYTTRECTDGIGYHVETKHRKI